MSNGVDSLYGSLTLYCKSMQAIPHRTAGGADFIHTRMIDTKSKKPCFKNPTWSQMKKEVLRIFVVSPLNYRLDVMTSDSADTSQNISSSMLARRDAAPESPSSQ
jgi:hypothetical protein